MQHQVLMTVAYLEWFIMETQIIEEFEERFTLEDCTQMLQIIAEALPRVDDVPMEDVDGEEQGAET
jgi:hypothetical protein